MFYSLIYLTRLSGTLVRFVYPDCHYNGDPRIDHHSKSLDLRFLGDLLATTAGLCDRGLSGSSVLGSWCLGLRSVGDWSLSHWCFTDRSFFGGSLLYRRLSGCWSRHRSWVRGSAQKGTILLDLDMMRGRVSECLMCIRKDGSWQRFAVAI